MYPYRLKGQKNPGDYPWRKYRKRREALENAFLLKQKGIEAELEEYDPKKSTWIPINPSAYCRRCGRRLSDPSSVRNGIGPECIKKGSKSN